MAQYMFEIIDEEDRERVHENLLVGPGKVQMEVLGVVMWLINYY